MKPTNFVFINKYKLSKLASHGVIVIIVYCKYFIYKYLYGVVISLFQRGVTFLSSDVKIIIGSNVMFGANVMIVTGNHHIVGKYMIDVKDKRIKEDEVVVIEDNVCWYDIKILEKAV